MNLPNKLTVLRICMIPFFVAALLYENGADQTMRIIANVIFITASLTDLLDGKIARKYGLVIAASYWGKFKTVFQMTAVVLLIFNIPALSVLTSAVLWIAVILTVVSLVDYVAKNIKVLTEGGL